MDAMTLFSVLMVRRAVEDSLGSSETRTRAPLLTVRPANLQVTENALIKNDNNKSNRCWRKYGHTDKYDLWTEML